MQRLEVSGAVRLIYGSLGVKRLIIVSKMLRKMSVGAAPPSRIRLLGNQNEVI